MNIRDFIPPIVIKGLSKILNRKTPAVWEGNFNNWSEAELECSGYNQKNILETCSASMEKIIKHEAVYERDGFLFNQKFYSWPLVAALLDCALENDGKLCVLDFGGALGSTYYQNVEFLAHVKVDWCIVEQENYVTEGKLKFETDDLHFFYSIEECKEKYTPDVILFSSVLQYLKAPYQIINQVKKLNPARIIIDRSSFIKADTEYITKQTVPEHIYNAVYPMWFFHENKFLSSFLPEYKVVCDFDSFCDESTQINKTKEVYWKGFLMKRNDEI